MTRFVAAVVTAYVAEMLQTLVEFPQRQTPSSFSLDQVMARPQEGVTAASS